MEQYDTTLSGVEHYRRRVQEAIYLRILFEESGMKVLLELVIKEDNQSCIAFTKNPGDHSRTKHIDVRACFVRQWVDYGELVLEGIDTKEQLADVFTKALVTKQYQLLRDHLVRPRPSVMV